MRVLRDGRWQVCVGLCFETSSRQAPWQAQKQVAHDSQLVGVASPVVRAGFCTVQSTLDRARVELFCLPGQSLRAESACRRLRCPRVDHGAAAGGDQRAEPLAQIAAETAVADARAARSFWVAETKRASTACTCAVPHAIGFDRHGARRRQRAELEVERERVENVVKRELEAREKHGRVAKEFELSKLRVERANAQRRRCSPR